MNKNAMLVDHWEEFNQKRIEFRSMLFYLIRDAYAKGASDFNDDGETETTLHKAEEYVNQKIKELF